MDHQELLKEIRDHSNKRFDRIEEKLDDYSELITVNKTDILWIKGFIKKSVSAAVAIITGVGLILYKKLFEG